ncbi:MAG TPA: ribosome silencing factor [Saprospiraceae bacterium]|nr:ribosome silencing factor [Saprospiraceae bacterium]HPQ20237.1 ribosome silencing factor [Saprospiraceae bacterium]HRX28908.1 ribosome silencing factor [Saprospiraceae bacterium]
MNKVKIEKSSDLLEKETLNVIIDAIHDIKGKNVLKLDLREISDRPADFFIICEGDSSTQVKSIADNIQKRTKQDLNLRATHVEGTKNATWILLDYFDIMVHVFYPETRQFYELEELWGDAKISEHNLN